MEIIKRQLFLIQLFLIAFTFGCVPNQDATHIPDKPYHHTEEGFRNPRGSILHDGFSFSNVWFSITKGFTEPFGPELPTEYIIPSDDSLKQFRSAQGKDSITWIGHSTVILRMDHQIIAIDPWFTNWVGVFHREVPPAFPQDQLPQIDTIVISHNHRDHLDIVTIEQFQNPEKITIIVPLGVGRYFKHIKFKKVIELDWHQSETIHGINYTALPVVHGSGRTLFDFNQTLWAGWSIESAIGKKVFFTEAEYGEIYKKIGEKYGPFNVAILSTGAYLPRGNMKGIHCIPANCVQIGLDIKAKNLIPIHWGTLDQGGEEFTEPGPLFRKRALEKGVDEKNIWMLKIGETHVF